MLVMSNVIDPCEGHTTTKGKVKTVEATRYVNMDRRKEQNKEALRALAA